MLPQLLAQHVYQQRVPEAIGCRMSLLGEHGLERRE
jgi:hypothetical protein